MGAMMTCSFGVAPSALVVIRPNKFAGVMPMANILDNKPMANIPTFGMCNSPANPATKRPPPVFFTPAPCVPATAAPWVPGVPQILVDSIPALDMNCKLMCNWGGVIQIVSPGQFTVQLP
jgi:hypothetical protein